MIIDDLDDSAYETEEDSFNKTLRTPYSLRVRPPVLHNIAVAPTQSPLPPAAISRDISIATDATLASSGPTSDSTNVFSDMTGLSTVRHASTLRTLSRTTSLAPSDSSSAVSRKRPLPVEPDQHTPVTSIAPSSASRKDPPKTPRRAVTRTRPVGTRAAMSRLPSLSESLDNAADGEDSDAAAPTAPKRRKITRSPTKPTLAVRVSKPPTSKPAAGPRKEAADTKTRGTTDAVRGSAPTRGVGSRASTRLASSRATSSSSSQLPSTTAAARHVATDPSVPRRGPKRAVTVKGKASAQSDLA